MQETLDQIPPEAWPLITLLLNVTMAVAAVWLALTVFIWWRRSASNLTPVQAAGKNKSAQPDFLKVDHAARDAAIARGAAYDEALEKRARQEAMAGKRRPASVASRLAGLLSFLMSIFTLATMIYGAIFQVSRMGSMMQEYSSIERIGAVIANHPIAFAVTSLVIIVHVYRFFKSRQWQEG